MSRPVKHKSPKKGPSQRQLQLATDLANYKFSGSPSDVSFLETSAKREMKCKIEGVPRPTYRTHASTAGNGKPYTYNPRPNLNKSLRAAIETAYSRAPFTFDLSSNENHPVEMSINFYLTRPKNHYVWDPVHCRYVLPTSAAYYCSKVPDIDNLSKLVLDCMQGLLFKDDRCVCVLKTQKLWLQKPGSFYVPEQKGHGTTIFRVTQFKVNCFHDSL